MVMDVRNGYEELLAITAVSSMFLAMGYVLLTGYGIGYYMATRAEAGGYPGVHVISEEISSFTEPKQVLGDQVRVIRDRLRLWKTVSVTHQIGEFNGDMGHFPL